MSLEYNLAASLDPSGFANLLLGKEPSSGCGLGDPAYFRKLGDETNDIASGVFLYALYVDKDGARQPGNHV